MNTQSPYLLWFTVCVFLLAGCSKKEDIQSDIVYGKPTFTGRLIAEPGIIGPHYQVVSGSMVLADIGIDLNQDGFSDYSLMISKILADGIYYPKDASAIYLRPVQQHPQQINPFNPLVAVEENTPILYSPFAGSGLAKLCRMNDEMPADFDFRQVYYLYKDDAEDSYQRTGNYYIALKMERNNQHYYGWVQVNVENFAVTVKDFAFCKTPGKKIKMGATK